VRGISLRYDRRDTEGTGGPAIAGSAQGIDVSDYGTSPSRSRWTPPRADHGPVHRPGQDRGHLGCGGRTPGRSRPAGKFP